MRTIEWPDRPDGRPIVYVTAVKAAVIFKASENKPSAKDFMRYLLRPEVLGPYLEGSLGRWFPVMPALARTAYWSGTDDPHRITHRRMYMEREQEPFPHVYNHKLIRVAAENAYGRAVTRVVLEGWRPEAATDELIARIKELAG